MNVKCMTLAVLAVGAAEGVFARTVKVSDFGYDAEDSTRFLQAAFDSGAERVIVDRQAGPWYTLPLKGRSNQEVVFEDGVELVAKKGAFLGLRDYLLYHENTTNVVIRGLGEKGGTLRMHKKDYQKPPYKPGEWRYALRLEGVVNALVENMSFVSSGGDGIVVCGRRQTPRNVTIRKCVCDDNHRQGISVIQADGLLIEDTVLRNTSGTPPQAGIDFEPDHNREMLRNCVMRRCVSENNKGSGYEFYFNAMDDSYVPVSIRIEDCVAIGNGNSVSIGGGGSRFEHVVRGSLAFTNCVFREAGTAGINLFGKPADAFSVTFDDCTVERAKAGWLGADIVLWNQNCEQQFDDGIAFNNLKIVQTGKPHDWFSYKKASIGRRPVTDITGDVTVTDVKGETHTVRLDEAWRSSVMPKPNPSPLPERVSVKGLVPGLKVRDAHPGEMTEYAGSPACHQICKYAFAVDRPRTVRFRMRQIERPGVKATSAAGTLKFAHVATGAKASLPMPGFEPEIVAFEAKRAGLYELTVSAFQSYFRIEAADVPLALDVHEKAQMLVSPEQKPFSVWIAAPGGQAFSVLTCGSDASASYAPTLVDPSGKRHDSRDRVYAWTALAVPAADAAEGLWRLDGRAAEGYQYWLMQLDLRGVPGYFFLSPDRTWRFDADVRLVEDGVVKCRVVVADDAHPALKFGAKEIEKYLLKATGCGDSSCTSGGTPLPLTQIRIWCDAGCSELREDGFILDVKPTGVDIIGQNPRGALYGCYEILKKYAGMRWIMPGEDGEYCVLKGKTVAVPLGRSVHNPYLKIRKTIADNEDAWLWHARNNMTGETASRNFEDPKTGKPADKAERLAELCVKGVGTAGNSHIMMDMMCAWAGKGTKAAIDALFAAHPEYFPLIRGQRIPIYGAYDPNPCVSNPELLDLMAKNLYDRIKGPHGSEDFVTIGNNDTTVWCECEACLALDAPELKGTKGARSDRYWYTVGEIAKRVWAVDPSVRLGGWAYQDFWYPPAREKLDPRLRAFISFNNQCWRHAVDDPACSVNAEWRNIFRAWAKTGHPLVCNRDEISCNGSAGSSYAPVEDVLRKNFLAYPEYGCAGSSFCVYAPFQHRHHLAKPPFYGKADRWHGMWQTCYMSARMMWDPKGCDFDAELEEACRLFYGEAAWNGGMKEFRALHKKAWFETPGCYGWALGAPLGRCLDQAGVEERLVALMDAAVEAAEASGDARAIAHMRRERDVFACTWLHERKAYLENFKELTAYRKQGEIKVDGVLDEADWANADALGNFKAGGHTPKGTKVEQSAVRVVYDPETLYVSVECLEPTPEKMLAADRMEEDPATRYRNFGSHVEIFYNYPDMFEKYYHLMVNVKGLVMSAIQISGTQRDNTFKTSARVATKVLKDRWIAEIAIPTSEIGMKCFDGATWKLNVGRSRKLEGMAAAKAETSSCCNGAFHGAANFVNVKFVPSRAKGLHQGARVSAWENSGFEAGVSNAEVGKHYKWTALTFPADNDHVPKGWYGKFLNGEYITEGDNRFVRIRPGKDSYLSQYFVSDAPGKARISFRFRGRGKVALWTALYTDTPTKRGYKLQDGTSKNEIFTATGDWQCVTVDRVKNGKPTERMAVRFAAQKDSEIDIDDVVVSPIDG